MIRDKLIVLPFAVSASFFIILIFLSLNFIDDSGKLIINYDLAGKPVLGDFSTIFGAVLIFGIISAINYALVYLLYTRERFLAYIASIITPFIGVLLFLMMGAIKSLN